MWVSEVGGGGGNLGGLGPESPENEEKEDEGITPSKHVEGRSGVRVREEANVVNPGALVSGIKSSEPLGAARRCSENQGFH